MPINDPIAHWRLDDGSGTAAADSSGNGYNLTLSNAPAWITPAQIGGGLNFVNASSQKGETSAAGLLASLQGASIFTIAFWARAPAYNSDRAVFAIREGVDFANALLIIYPYDTVVGNSPRVFWNGADIMNPAAEPTIGEWHHFVFVSRGATDHELFVDNASIATSAANKSNAALLSHVTVGAWDGGQFFDGDLDDVRIYNRALSTDEIAELFAWRGDPVAVPIPSDSIGGGRPRQSRRRPYWWHSYVEQWLDELEERNAEWRRLQAELDAQEAERREAEAWARLRARRVEEARRAREEQEAQEARAAALGRRIAAITRERDAQREAEEERAREALARVRAKRDEAARREQEDDLRRLQAISGNRRARFNERFKAAIEAMRMQGWRIKE